MYEHYKDYRRKYKDEHRKRINTRHGCIRGGHYTTANIARHIKTDQHKYYEQHKLMFIIRKGRI